MDVAIRLFVRMIVPRSDTEKSQARATSKKDIESSVSNNSSEREKGLRDFLDDVRVQLVRAAHDHVESYVSIVGSFELPFDRSYAS